MSGVFDHLPDNLSSCFRILHQFCFDKGKHSLLIHKEMLKGQVSYRHLAPRQNELWRILACRINRLARDDPTDSSESVNGSR